MCPAWHGEVLNKPGGEMDGCKAIERLALHIVHRINWMVRKIEIVLAVNRNCAPSSLSHQLYECLVINVLQKFPVRDFQILAAIQKSAVR
jgi:hypothetical protein